MQLVVKAHILAFNITLTYHHDGITKNIHVQKSALLPKVQQGIWSLGAFYTSARTVPRQKSRLPALLETYGRIVVLSDYLDQKNKFCKWRYITCDQLVSPLVFLISLIFSTQTRAVLPSKTKSNSSTCDLISLVKHDQRRTPKILPILSIAPQIPLRLYQFLVWIH